MSIFDPKTKFLILGDKPLDDIIDKYEDSDQYRSYNKYLEEGLEKDIREILIPTLNTLFEDKDVNFSEQDSKIEIKKSTEFRGNINNNITLSLLNLGATEVFTREDGTKGFKVVDKTLNPFTVLQLPYMDRSGIVYRKDKKYVMINTITLDDSITFDGNKLKFVDNSNSLVFSGSVNPKVEMFSTSITAIDFVTMLAKFQYGNDKGIEYAKRFIYSLKNPSILNAIAGTESDHIFLGKDAFENSVEQIISKLNDESAKNFQLEEKLTEEYLDTTTTRRQLNEMLSFNNALGRTISRDIVTRDGKTIADEGSIVTRSMVSKLNNNLIDTIYVRKPLKMLGQFIAEPIFLGNKIIKGTPVIQEMINFIPELEDYAIAPKDYTLEEDKVLVIYNNTMITEELCNYLEYIGKTTIEYKEKQHSKKILTAYFEEEYINNRHFPISDLNMDIEEDDDNDSYSYYRYVDDNGNVNPESGILTCHDIAALTSLFMKLLVGEHHELVSDPDSGLRKKVEQSYDHFRKAFYSATKQFMKITGPAMKRSMNNSNDFNNSDKMNLNFSYFSEAFWRHMQKTLKVIDMLDTSNPVATISSLTKINTIVKNDDSISDSMRGLSMGHYGRICPYETPQSKKLGIVNNMSYGCIIEDGTMYTRYYKLRHKDGKSFIDGTPVKMNVVDEEMYRISDISTLVVNKETGEVTSNGKVPARVPARTSLEKTIFASIDLKDVQYISISPNQHESIACTTIPFAGGDDATRVSFGLSMVKQAKGLVNGEVPLICTTGFLNIPNMNSYYKIFAEHDGRVDSSETGRLVVTYDGHDKPTSYEFEAITLSFDTAIIRVTEVVKGQRIKKGQTLLSSNFVKDGIMVLGVNAIVAYMTDGYNYEDGVPVGRRLSEKLTSYGVHKDEFKISNNITNVTVKDVKYGDYIDKDDKMFIKSELFSKLNDYRDTLIRSHKSRGFIAKYEIVRDSYNTNRVKEIKVQSVSFDELNESDKLCNRHGNKGVTCKIHDNSEMPYFENGEFIDIKYNPNGIVSRMNIGQTLEASAGLACYVLGIKILCGSFNSPSTEDIKMLLSYTVDLANRDDINKVISEYPNIPQELHEHCRNNIRKIRHWRGTFNKEGKAYLIDPRSGKRTLKRVNVGVNYVYKLVQEGEGKLHSRGGFLTSSYVEKTESPTKGAAKGGGQRMGYMELDALASYGASNLLKEITNERGDNYIARNNLTVKSLHSGEPNYLLDEEYGVRRSTEYMLELFKALGIHSEMTEDEINLNNPEERNYYKKKVLLDATFQGDEEEEDTESISFKDFKNLRVGGK